MLTFGFVVKVTDFLENFYWTSIKKGLPQFRCIRLGSVRSSHLPFKMHYQVGYVRSSLLVFICMSGQ